jgi:pyruvate/2-oxoglutarate dehydrogenase complex dihydrolipoamide acyltransferase (E2) component
MDKVSRPYHILDFPVERRGILLANDLNFRKHTMYGLLEVDVTVARQFIADHRARTGERLSFTGYLAFCLARAVDENKEVQAYLKGRRQLVVFEDVDVGLMIERQSGDKRVPEGYVIRGANHKTFEQIHDEIRAVQSQPAPARNGMPSWLGFVLSLPGPVPGLITSLFGAAVRRNPKIAASMLGTVGITSVGMFGKGQGGWGVVPTAHVLNLVLASTAWKPAVIEGRIEPREMLHMTVVFDHDVIDGAPAARFARRLVELIEAGYGLQ